VKFKAYSYSLPKSHSIDTKIVRYVAKMGFQGRRHVVDISGLQHGALFIDARRIIEEGDVVIADIAVF